MPTFRHGKASVFKVDNNAGTLTDISSALTDVSFPQSVETAETTAFGSSAKTYIVGLTDGTLSVSGNFDKTVDIHLAAIVGKTDSVSFEYGPEGSTSGFAKYTGESFLTSYEKSGSVGDVVTFSAEFQVTAAITLGTYA